MNLYGRVLLLLVKLLFTKSRFKPLETVKTPFRVWPHDMDMNIHLTSARYFSFADIARLNWLRLNGLMSSFFTQGYRAVLSAQELTYIREFPPLSRVQLEIELKCWDEKYGYFEQRYYYKGKLYAVGHSRMAILRKRKVVAFDEVFSHLGYSLESPAPTLAIVDWKETLSAKKDFFAK